MQMQKKLYIFKHIANSYFLLISIIFRLIPNEIPKKVFVDFTAIVFVHGVCAANFT
jgi:hypothetical protein